MMGEKIPIFSILGSSDSGITYLMSQLIEKLKEKGHSVATIKHTRGDFSLDKKGKDTWRHAEAGAELVVFSTPKESDFLMYESLDLQGLTSQINKLGDFDVILVEGMKEEKIPRISVDKDFKEDVLIQYEDNLDEIINIIEKRIEVYKIINQLPGSDCGKCGYEGCEDLAEAVNDEDKALEECRELKSGRTVQVHVNEEKITLGDFPSKLVEKTIRGMLSSLKGIEGEEENIEIKISEDR